jgi:hypothetical protein
VLQSLVVVDDEELVVELIISGRVDLLMSSCGPQLPSALSRVRVSLDMGFGGVSSA